MLCYSVSKMCLLIEIILKDTNFVMKFYMNSYLATHCHKTQNDRNILSTAPIKTVFCLLRPLIDLQNTVVILQL